MTYGKALELLKQGKLVQREGWNGKGMFIFMRPGDTLSAEIIINKVKSLPDAVKRYYVGKFSHTSSEEDKGLGPKDHHVVFTPYLCMKAADGSIVNGWLASQTDMLSEDWQEFEV